MIGCKDLWEGRQQRSAWSGDSLRHSDLHVTNKYLQATTKSKRLAEPFFPRLGPLRV
jgi:hypothetical protein